MPRRRWATDASSKASRSSTSPRTSPGPTPHFLLEGWGVDLGRGAEKQLAGGGPIIAMLTRPPIAHASRLKLYAMPQYGVYRCKGDTHISIGIIDEQHFCVSFCEVLDLGPMKRLPMPARRRAP